MKVEEVIRAAVEAGYRGADRKLDLRLGEKYSEFGIAKDGKHLKHIYVRYVAKGYDASRLKSTYEETYNYYELGSIFLDPSFWQSLGKSLGWTEVGALQGWLNRWHDFIDHLAEGEAAEEFFKTIDVS